jgi:DNA-binding MurR/RpiR family transcriptional regulator
LALIEAANPTLTRSERRVAETVIEDPKIVAFGTVAQLAARSGSSGPTVLRFASKLGFHGFVDLQAAVQEEIADQLRPATQRIRERSSGDAVSRALAADLDNVRRTLEDVDGDEFADVVDLVADRRHRVWVIGSEYSGLPARLLAQQLDLLRDGVELLEGASPRVSRSLVGLEAGDVLIAFDLRRYERWIVDLVRRADERGALVVAVTDSRLSPLAEGALHAFVVAARGIGPFDSATGAVAFVHALGAAVAARLRRSATGRLDQIEASWAAAADFVDR